MNSACLKQGIPRKKNGKSLNDLAMVVLILLLLHRLSLKICHRGYLLLTLNTLDGQCVNIAEKLSLLNISDMLYSGDTTACSNDTDVLKDEPMDVDVKPNYRTAIVEQGYLLKPYILVLSLLFPYNLIKD